MTDDLVKWLRETEDHLYGATRCREAADHIEGLEYALRSIAEAPSGCHPAFGAELPDRTTIWKVVVYMQETATDALKEGEHE